MNLHAIVFILAALQTEARESIHDRPKPKRAYYAYRTDNDLEEEVNHDEYEFDYEDTCYDDLTASFITEDECVESCVELFESGRCEFGLCRCVGELRIDDGSLVGLEDSSDEYEEDSCAFTQFIRMIVTDWDRLCLNLRNGFQSLLSCRMRKR